jgi:glycosyltransferase involved in cell wall biosynthesis
MILSGETWPTNRRPQVVHLAASPFLGGPERQMLGLANALRCRVDMRFWSFAEGGRSKPFLDAAAAGGFEAEVLKENAPRYLASVREIAAKLRTETPDLVLTHGYKPDLIGGFAARRAGVPVVAVSRGWTAATFKVRLNELLDRLVLPMLDHVVCVSRGQELKVLRAGVPPRRVSTIHTAIDAGRFAEVDPNGRARLEQLFPETPETIVAAAGRLSPEKGFEILIEAAARVVRSSPRVGFAIFGEGTLRPSLERRIAERGLDGRFVLQPFRDDLDRLFPHFDLLALPSFTEGLPNVALEASAAGVPIVATDVGGNPEVVEDGVTGRIVSPGDVEGLASRIEELLGDAALRARMGEAGRARIRDHFSFEMQADRYEALFRRLLPAGEPAAIQP